MNKYLSLVIACLLALSLMTGCGDDAAPIKGADVSQPTADAQPSGNTAAPSQPAATGSASLSSFEESAARDKLKGVDKVSVGTPYKILSIGETYAFGAGVINSYPKETNFRLAIRFSEAKTTGGLATLIPGIDDTIYGWLSQSKFKTITVGSGEKAVMPIIVSVGPKISGSQDTIAGSYTFDVKVEYEKTPQFWDTYGQQKLVIKIK